jgi:ABC-type sugar transport system permease subunit
MEIERIHSGWRLSMLRRQDKIAGYAYMAPALLLVTFLLVYPMLSNVYISFFKWDGLKPMQWRGVDNYVRFFGDINFTHSFTNTWIWVAFTLFVVVGMALMLAVL